MLNTFIPNEDCCDTPLQRDISTGAINAAKIWECPKCGCVWVPVDREAGVREWQPRVFTEMFK